MGVAVCPKPETLLAFARGQLDGAELASVAEHVGACAACCRALKLIPDDSLPGLARAAAVAPATVHSTNAPSPNAPNPIKQEQIPAGFVNHSRYRLLSELGAGGMGTVYKAHDDAMDRVVALKVVSPHLTAKAGALARFQKEIRAAAKLEHPHIIRAYDTGEAGGAQFLVMEFVEGTSLDRLVAKKGPLSVPMACTFARQAALGLQHAAEKGMTHRDIKPQNLMVTKKGQVKILDFGLARFARTDDEAEQPAQGQKIPFGAAKAAANAGVTNPNQIMGTPDYLSPEQAKNSHDVDPRSDIYSLGCALYFLLTGKPPFAAATTLIDKLLAHTEDAPPPIREARFEVSEGLADVLAKMMAKNPAERYQTAREAADALHPHTRTTEAEPVFEVVDAVVVAPAPQVAAPAPLPEPAEELAFDTDPQRGGPTLAEVARPKKKKPKKRATWWKEHKWAVIGAAALFLFVAGVIALVASTAKKPAETPTDPPAGESAKNTPTPPQAKGKDDKGGKSNPWQAPTVIAPPKGETKVLYVLPSDGYWPHDYVEVRSRLEAKGAHVVTASTDGGSSKPHPDFPGDARPVPIDVRFTATMDLSEYAAVVFAGANSEEYFVKGGAAAKKVIERMQQAGKPVAAIGLGQAVLAGHMVLKGKHAAECEPLRRKHPFITNKDHGTWDGPGVTVDRSESTKVVITASGGRESREFADAILKVIEK
jgi:serine/threonine-protein kinase